MRVFLAGTLAVLGMAGCGRDDTQTRNAASHECEGGWSFRYTESGMLDKETVEMNLVTGDVSIKNEVWEHLDVRIRLDDGTALRIGRALRHFNWSELSRAGEMPDTIVDDSHWQVVVCLDTFAGSLSGNGSCDLKSCSELQAIVAMVESSARFSKLEEKYR